MGSGCNEVQKQFLRFQKNSEKLKAYVEKKKQNKIKQKATTTNKRQNP